MGTASKRIDANARHLDRDGGAPARLARHAVANSSRPLRLTGDQALQPCLKGWSIQAKLNISGPDDIFELQAEQMANAVMQMRTPAVGLQQRPLPAAVGDVTQDDGVGATPEIAIDVQALADRGQHLPEAVLAFMEPRFNADFHAVRIHTDARASELARAVGAQAFTVGRDVVFGPGHFSPDAEQGRHLIAHELTHVLQQTGAVPVAQALEGLHAPPRFGIERTTPQGSLQRQQADKTPTKSPEVPAAAKTPLEQAAALLQRAPATVKERAAWILQAADQGFVSFNTPSARANLEGVRDGDKVGDLDPKMAGYDVPILVVELGLAQTVVRRWVAAKGAGAKPSIEFGSMIRPMAGGGPHGKGKAIDINALRMAASVDATVLVLNDLDSAIHKAYGLGLPFQGEFFDKADELATKKAAAERSAAAVVPLAVGGSTDAGTQALEKVAPASTTADAGIKPADHAPAAPLTIKDAVQKFESRLIESTATIGPAGKWIWKDGTQDAEWNGAYKRLKSQKLKDALAVRSKDGFHFDIFPDNDDHLHLDAR